MIKQYNGHSAERPEPRRYFNSSFVVGCGGNESSRQNTFRHRDRAVDNSTGDTSFLVAVLGTGGLVSCPFNDLELLRQEV